MNELLFNAGKVIGAFTTLLSFVALLVPFAKGIKKIDRKKLFEYLFAMLVSFIGGVWLIWYSGELVEVPAVEGKLYSDAKSILIEQGFDFNTVLGKENCKVLEQSPEAGEKVRKETKVLMILEGMNTDEPMSTPTSTNTPTPKPTNTPKPTLTNTPTPKPTNTPKPTPTSTPTPVPHNHNWVESVVEAATCASAGKRIFTCTCGESRTETIPAMGHTWTDDGTKKYCTSCGHVAAVWTVVDDWTPTVLTAGVEEKIETRNTISTSTKYQYVVCYWWYNYGLTTCATSVEKAERNGMSWNGVIVSKTDSNNVKYTPATKGKFSEGKYGESNGTYTKAVSELYDSLQNPMPDGYYTEEKVEESVTVTEYRKWKLIYQ